MNVKTIVVSMFATNCYLVWCPDTKEAVIIDPGAEGKKVVEAVNTLGLKVRYIINTHAHVDHIGANGKLKSEYAVPIMFNAHDLDLYNNPGFGLKLVLRKQPAPDHFLSEGDTVRFGNLELKVVETPGHTLGGISLVSDTALFCGDTLFANAVGRTDLAGGSYDALIGSIRRKLLTLPPETIVYPGHGPQTTIGTELKTNPFITGASL